MACGFPVIVECRTFEGSCSQCKQASVLSLCCGKGPDSGVCSVQYLLPYACVCLCVQYCFVFFLFSSVFLNLCYSTLLFSSPPHTSLFASSSFPMKLLFLFLLQLQLWRLGFNAQTRTESLPTVCVFIHLCGFSPSVLLPR